MTKEIYQKPYTPYIRISENSKKIKRFFDEKTKKLEELQKKQEIINSLKTKLNFINLRKIIKEREEYKKPEYHYPSADQVLGPVQLQQLHLEQSLSNNPYNMQQWEDDTCNMFSQL